MKFFKTAAIAATLLAGVSAANATVLNNDLASFGDISSARNASVLTVTSSEAKLLGYDNEVTAVQARVKLNPVLVQTIERQGYTIDQVVGASGDQNDLTLYVL